MKTNPSLPGGEIACFFSAEDVLLTRSTNPNQGECLSAQTVDELVEVSHLQPFPTITIKEGSVKTNQLVCFFHVCLLVCRNHCAISTVTFVLCVRRFDVYQMNGSVCVHVQMVTSVEQLFKRSTHLRHNTQLLVGI